MECNKDEAIRAKTIAEGKLEKKDFAGAKKFALKAQALYPALDGLLQLLTTLDVYISAEKRSNGEVDWYGVLGVSPSADDDTVRKQYRKLALMLHPDKNKSVGADGAFKILSEAWSLLSDKSKRVVYKQKDSPKGFQHNKKETSKGFQHKGTMHSGGPSASSRGNGFHNSSGKTSSSSKPQSDSARVQPTHVNPPPHQRNDTFWTICHRCKMHYEYLKIYLNHTLLCPNCQEAFLATETSPPLNNSKPSNSNSQQNQNIGNHPPNGNQLHCGRNVFSTKISGHAPGIHQTANHSNIHWDPISGSMRIGSTDPSIAAKVASVVRQAHEKMKRERDGSQNATVWDRGNVSGSIPKDEILFKQRRLSEDIAGSSSKAAHKTDRVYGFSTNYSKPNRTRELTSVEVRNMLAGKARKEILGKLNEWILESKSKPSNTEKETAKGNKKEKARTAKVSVQGENLNSNASSLKELNDANTNVEDSAGDVDDPAIQSMNVPDPDFHNFDLDRTERCFGDNEVWAAYDDDDGMPRFYALIHQVISRKPFKVKLSWLNSKTNAEFGPIDWVASGFYKTCGEFRVGKHEISKSINSFSHKVKWSKGPRGIYHLFPKEGETWALYRNWSPDWNEHTPDEVIHKYDMVVVLDNYNEENGVSVAPLVKVAGFKTVFQPHPDPGMVKRIPKEEMFRLSHQLPNHLLTGEEAQNAPKGCLELDPAATPLELLQITTDADEVTVQNNGDGNEEAS